MTHCSATAAAATHKQLSLPAHSRILATSWNRREMISCCDSRVRSLAGPFDSSCTSKSITGFRERQNRLMVHEVIR